MYYPSGNHATVYSPQNLIVHTRVIVCSLYRHKTTISLSHTHTTIAITTTTDFCSTSHQNRLTSLHFPKV